MPLFSIVMPTYNRADTILRAVDSVRAQTHADWELVVVDDGSVDDTGARIAALGEPRIRVLRQDNHGVTVARNTGLASARGELVAFLDSDDAWLPHHLELAAAFFRAHPGEHLFTSEFWEDFGTGDYVKHYRPEVGVFAPNVARRIGSKAFDAPAPSGDPYLRFYDTCEPVGPWGRAVLEKTPYAEGALHYRGNIFPGWRWEFLMSMQSTVLTRAALERVGLPDRRYRVTSDYDWLARLCKAFTTNMVNVPGTIKHEYGQGKAELTEGHLVTGKTAVQFHKDMIGIFEELYLKDAPDDAELQGIRAYRRLRLAEAMLLAGQRGPAIEQLDEAVRHYRGLDAQSMRWLARLLPHDRLPGAAYKLSRRAAALPAGVVRRLRRAVPASAATTPAASARADLALEVRALRSAAEVGALASQIDALNLASRRPCPFASSEFLAANLAHDEFAAPGDQLLFLAAFEHERLVGYLPLRKTTQRLLGVPYGRIEFFSLGYRDRPFAVARLDDEAACSAAFYRHLRERERGWSLLELTSQDADSGLGAILGDGSRGFWARRFETDANTTIPLPFPTLAEYYKSLDGDFRRKVTARCRKLLQTGKVEVITSSDPAARGAMLDMYLDVERRSWKAEARAGIARHPERLALVRALCASPMTTVVQTVLLDGVPIAGLFAIEFGESWYILETTYDAAYSDLAPGYLLHLVGLGEAIARGQRAFNLLHAYGYYKLSWNGVSTPTGAVQVYRVPSMPYLKARAGELKRAARRGAQEEEQFNPARRATGDEGTKQAKADDGARPPREDAARLATAARAKLEASGAQVTSVGGEALLAALPFPLEAQTKPQKPPKQPKARPQRDPGERPRG
jgi:glycosyltransferase involved in cell wall biosynthesis